VAANPGDAKAKQDLENAYKALQQTLAQARSALSNETSSLQNATGANASELVQAAKEEAAAALLLADEADKLADRISDPVKKAAIKKAIQEVRECARRVVQMAELLAKNPHDMQAQEKLTSAQKDLANAIEKVVNMTSGSSDREISDALAQMREGDGGSEGDLLLAAQKLLDKIAATFGNPNKKMTPQEVIGGAKELSLEAAELARQLREMAAKTNDPVWREKLLNAAKIIRDGGIQIKILSAVRAAGGEDKGNSVVMATKTLQTNIQDIIKQVRAEQLKNKFRNTVKQTMAINKVVSVWKKKGGVK